MSDAAGNSERGRGRPAARLGSRATRVGALAAAVLAFLALPALAGAAVPPQFPGVWTSLSNGLRQVPGSTDTRAFCRGPAGSVYEVALGRRGGRDAVITRVRVSDGAVLDQWTYPAAPSANDYVPRAAARDAHGDLVLAIEVQSGARNWRVLKFTPAGKLLWKAAYDSGHGQDTPYGMVVDHRGNVIVAGTSQGHGSGGYDSAVVKWSGSGQHRWTRVISTMGRDLIGAVAVDAGDNVYVAGQLGLGGSRLRFAKATVRSYTASGRLRWHAEVANPVGDATFRRLVVRGTGVYVAGQTDVVPANAGLLAAKYTTSGTRAWGTPTHRQLDYPHGAFANGLAVDASGAPVIVGVAFRAGAAGEDLGAVWKLTATGTTAWHTEFANPAWPRDGEFDAVGVDGANRIYAAGGVLVNPGTGNLLMVRYLPGGGEDAMWRAEGQQSGPCAFSRVLVLSASDVLAAGRVAGNGADAAVYRARTTP